MRKNKAFQAHSKLRLKQDARLSPEDIALFLENFQQVAHGQEGKGKLISIRVPEKLLEMFKQKAKRENFPYQTQIIRLMREWVLAENR